VDTGYARGGARRWEVTGVAGLAWTRIGRAGVRGRTVTLKAKFADFRIITRSKSFSNPVADAAAFEQAGQALLGTILPVAMGIRLLGLGLHSILDEEDRGPVQLGLEID